MTKLTERNTELRDLSVQFLGYARRDLVEAKEKFERTAKQYAPLALKYGMSIDEVAIALDIDVDSARELVK